MRAVGIQLTDRTETDSHDDCDSPLTQMKRRREAARRLVALETGYRDPHFDVRPTNGVSR